MSRSKLFSRDRWQSGSHIKRNEDEDIIGAFNDVQTTRRKRLRYLRASYLSGFTSFQFFSLFFCSRDKLVACLNKLETLDSYAYL